MYNMFLHVSGAEKGIFEDRRESGTLHEAQ